MMKRRIFIKHSAMLSATVLLPRLQRSRSLGVALVGLGYYSRDLLAPALQLTSHCHIAGIVTGSPDKIPVWQEKYNIKDTNVYNYDNMHQIADNPEIDVIYIVLPTGLHAEYAIKAANTGKHVWCEKPMARTEEECKAIIDACKKNKVKLSIGYRMQHEPNTRMIITWAHERPFGKMKSVYSEAGYFDGRTNHWKQQKAMGGGALYDMGVYPLNACRYSTALEPISVLSAKHSTKRPEIYHEVDETTEFKLEFPEGIVATGKTSFGEGMNILDVKCDRGSYYLEPFQSYSGVKGMASNGMALNPWNGNQQARQMDDDALAIINNSPVMVPGEEGMADIRIVEAIYRSAREKKRIEL